MRKSGVWDALIVAYPKPELVRVETAYVKCINILADQTLSSEERVKGFANCLAEKASK